MRPRLPFPLVLAVLLATSIPGLLAQARDVDVLLYMTAAARSNAQHTLPYVSAWIEKGPLAMGIFQLVDAVAGRYAFPALSVLWLALAAAGAWLSGALAREAGCAWADGWASLGFVIGIGAVGGTPNTEVFALVPTAAALLLWRRGSLLVSGLYVGAGFLCRQNAGVLLPVLVGLELGRGGGFRGAGALTGGFAIPVAATVVLYAAAGAWGPFVFCFWEYNAAIYLAATHVSPARIARIPWDALVHFLWPIRTTALLAAFGIARGPWIALAAAALLVAVVPGLRFFSHYAALALPFLAALAALGLEAAVARVGTRAALLLALAGFSWGLELAPRGWLDTASRLRSWAGRGGLGRLGDPMEWPGRDETVMEVARFLREHSTPEDRVFVWGMRPHVLVYADRIQATRFTTSTFLTGLVPWERVAPFEDTTRWIVPGAWDTLVAELSEEKPRFVVDASRDHHFGDGAYAPSRFPALATLLERDYVRVHESGDVDRFVVWARR